jgi:uncharacterized protein YjbI with pentapeptide repeats
MFDTDVRLRQNSEECNRLPPMVEKLLKSRRGKIPQNGENSCCEGRLHVIFTSEEKRLLFGQVFSDADLNRIDFSCADLRETQFLNVSLNECDFSGADLRGTSFLSCDLRSARFDQAVFGRTRFDNSWVVGARGLSGQRSYYVRKNGGLLWFS